MPSKGGRGVWGMHKPRLFRVEILKCAIRMYAENDVFCSFSRNNFRTVKAAT